MQRRASSAGWTKLAASLASSDGDEANEEDQHAQDARPSPRSLRRASTEVSFQSRPRISPRGAMARRTATLGGWTKLSTRLKELDDAEEEKQSQHEHDDADVGSHQQQEHRKVEEERQYQHEHSDVVADTQRSRPTEDERAVEPESDEGEGDVGVDDRDSKDGDSEEESDEGESEEESSDEEESSEEEEELDEEEGKGETVPSVHT